MSSKAVLGLALTGATVLSTIGAHGLFAQERRETYVPPAQRETLAQREVPDQRLVVTIDRYTLAPGYVGGRHYHTGPVSVYVLEGAFTIDEDGKPQRTFRAGEVYDEPIGTPMQARNLNASEPSKILVMQVTKQGEPLMYRAD